MCSYVLLNKEYITTVFCSRVELELCFRLVYFSTRPVDFSWIIRKSGCVKNFNVDFKIHRNVI